MAVRGPWRKLRDFAAAIRLAVAGAWRRLVGSLARAATEKRVRALSEENQALQSQLRIARLEMELLAAALENYRVQAQADIAVQAARVAAATAPERRAGG